MKTKLEMAHEYLLKIMSNSPLVEQVDIEFAVSTAWSYARMMHSEKVRDDKVGYEQKRKEVRDMLNAPNTFVEREGQHFDDVEEWQPDWSQAPEGFVLVPKEPNQEFKDRLRSYLDNLWMSWVS